MHVAKKFTVTIALRADLKGLPNKNIAALDGKPLYMRAVDLAKTAKATPIIIQV